MKSAPVVSRSSTLDEFIRQYCLHMQNQNLNDINQHKPCQLIIYNREDTFLFYSPWGESASFNFFVFNTTEGFISYCNSNSLQRAQRMWILMMSNHLKQINCHSGAWLWKNPWRLCCSQLHQPTPKNSPRPSVWGRWQLAYQWPICPCLQDTSPRKFNSTIWTFEPKI